MFNKIGMQTGGTDKLLGERGALAAIREAGFDCADFNIDSYFKYDAPDESILLKSEAEIKEHFNALKAYCDEIGLVCNQCHAPFPTYIFNDEVLNAKTHKAIENSILVASLMGAKHLVIHPCFKGYHDLYLKKSEEHALNIEFYKSFISLAKKYGIVICLENMFTWNRRKCACTMSICSTPLEFSGYIDELNAIAGEKTFAACLDVGHVILLDYNPMDFIYELGDRIEVLHIHDNDGHSDWHTCPRTGALVWDELIAALKDINFSGVFSLEAAGFVHRVKPRFIPKALKFMSDTARDLIED